MEMVGVQRQAGLWRFIIQQNISFEPRDCSLSLLLYNN